MSLFNGIRDAKVGQGGVYFLPGLYEVEIQKVHTLVSRKREDLFIVEAKILESNNPDRAPGSSASWLVNFKQDAALGNIKGFIAACNGIDPADEVRVNDEVDEDVCEYVVSEENPLAGTRVKLEAVMKKTKSGGDFTLHIWNPVAE